MAPEDSPPPAFDLVWLRPGGRKRQTPLSRERIVQATIAIADEEGLQAVTMRRIAARLGSGTNSLYWYLKSKEDLFELMFDEVMGEVALPERPGAGWRAELREVARQTRSVHRRHPWLAQLGIQPGLGPNTRRYFGFAKAALEELHLDTAMVAQVLAVLNNYILGEAQRATAWDGMMRRSGLDPREWARRFRAFVEQTVRVRDPELAADLEARIELSGGEGFEFGLDCVLDGIASRVQASRDHAVD